MNKKEIMTSLTASELTRYVYIAESNDVITNAKPNLHLHVRAICTEKCKRPNAIEITDVLFRHLQKLDSEECRDLLILIQEIFNTKSNKIAMVLLSTKNLIKRYMEEGKLPQNVQCNRAYTLTTYNMINIINMGSTDFLDNKALEKTLLAAIKIMMNPSNDIYNSTILSYVNNNRFYYTYTDLLLEKAIDDCCNGLGFRRDIEGYLDGSGGCEHGFEVTIPSYRTYTKDASDIRESVGKIQRKAKHKQDDVKGVWKGFVQSIQDRKAKYKDKKDASAQIKMDKQVIDLAREIEVVDQDINNVTQHFEKTASVDKLYDVKQKLSKIESKSKGNEDRVKDIKDLYKHIGVILNVLKKIDTKYDKNSVHIKIEPSMTDSIKRARTTNLAREESVKESLVRDIDEAFITSMVDVDQDCSYIREIQSELKVDILRNERIMESLGNLLHEKNEKARQSGVTAFVNANKEMKLDKKVLDLAREIEMCDQGVSVITTQNEKERVVDTLFDVNKSLVSIKAKSKDNPQRLSSIKGIEDQIDVIKKKLKDIDLNKLNTSSIKESMDFTKMDIHEGVVSDIVSRIDKSNIFKFDKKAPAKKVKLPEVVTFKVYAKKGKDLYITLKDIEVTTYDLNNNIKHAEEIILDEIITPLSHVNVKMLKFDVKNKVAICNIPTLVDEATLTRLKRVYDNKIITKVNNMMK